jgi:ATP/maltotriose-dependent transcriptional regulator MalT
MKRAKAEKRRTFYFKHRLASGKIRDVEVYSGPIKVYGRELLYSIIHDVTKRKQAELSLIERGKELENKSYELEEVNTALKVLLKHRDEDKKELEKKVITNVKKLVFPYLEKLNNSRLNDRQKVYLNIIQSNLEDIVAPFLRQLSLDFSDLTPSEIQIAGLVKDGKTTKEIADLLNSSTGAVNFHRNNIRKKLGLRNTKTNLRSFLLPLS